MPANSIDGIAFDGPRRIRPVPALGDIGLALVIAALFALGTYATAERARARSSCSRPQTSKPAPE